MTHYVQPTRRSNGNVVVPAHVAHLQSATMDGGMYPHYVPTSEPYGVAPPTMMVDDYGQANPYMQAQHDPHTVFVPLPQAPRLPAAAARASALATMYYDPTTMFPPHMLGHGASDPWSQNIAPGGAAIHHDYSSNPYAEAAAPPQYGHADPMNGHGGHNQSFATQQIHPSSNVGLRTRSLAADPYVSRQHQAGAFGVQGRGSVPAPTYHSTQEQGNGAWAPSRWTGAAHFVDGSQAPVAHRHSYAATAPGDHAGYGHGAMHGHHQNHQNPDLAAANAVQQHNAGWQYRFNADMRRHWEAQQQINSAAQAAQPQQPPMMYSQPTMADARPFGETRIAMDHDRMQQAWQWNNAAVQPSMVQQQNAAKWQSRHAVPDNNANGDKNAFWQAQQAQQHQVHHHDMAQRAAMDNVSVADKGPAAEPIPPQKNAGPAPPSPGTLDKSAVPISSVGAEIVWIAAAALLDPTLWLPNKEEAATSIQRKRMASHGSSSDVSASTLHTPMTSPVNGFQEEWQRQPTYARRNVGELLEESSASSSEPGTPPSTVPSRIWEQQHGEGHDAKRISLGALRGMRSLGLSGQEDNAGPRASMDRGSASPREMQSPRSRSFRRLESFDRSRETVASVADLLSWDCKWSANDEKLDSLRHSRSIGGVVVQQPGQAAVAPAMTRRTSSQNRMCREDPNSTVSTGLAMSSTEASPAFRRFTHQVLAQTLVSPTAFMLGIMYALRVLRLAIVVDQNGEASVDPEAVEIFAQPPSAAPFKLFTLGMMIANKHLDDNTFLNKTWNEVTGIALPEINRAERWYLERCSYEITVPEVTWIAFLRRLHERTEQRVNMLTAAKRYRVSTVKQAPDAPRRHDQYVPSHAGNEEAQKRFLLCIEEALQNLGYAPQFSLSNASSPLQQRDAALPLHTEQSQRLTRPKKSLTHMHQHCHSAPAVGLDEDSDIFDDEDGPYRPYRRSAANRTTTTASNAASNVPLRNSIATEGGLLSRSYSDSVPVIAPSSCAAQEHHRARKAADAMQLVGDGNAPLAPSVLLELLNKGQHLAHVAS